MSESEDTTEAWLVAIGVILGVPALVALISIWNGYVLSILWGWFVVPFLKLPALSVPEAIGLVFVGHMLAGGRASRKTEKGKFFEELVTSLLAPLLALGVAWVVKGFL